MFKITLNLIYIMSEQNNKTKNASYFALWRSKVCQTAQTPNILRYLLDLIYFPEAKGSVFDPCPANPTFDGLKIEWKKHNYVNPEFKDIPLWLDKAAAEAKKQHNTVVLMPVRLCTKYFSNILDCPDLHSIVLWTNKVQFIPYTGTLNVPLMTLYFSPRRTPLSKMPFCSRVGFDFLDTTMRTFKDYVSEKYGSSKVKIHKLNKLEYVCASPSDLIMSGVTRCQQHKAPGKEPYACVALLSADCINNSSFRAALPFIRDVAIVYPKHKLFMAASCLVCMSTVPLRLPQLCKRRLPIAYIGNYRDKIIRQT